MTYTKAIGDAGEAYMAKFAQFAHQLPAQFRWSELWDAMYAASTVVSIAQRPFDVAELGLTMTQIERRRMAQSAGEMGAGVQCNHDMRWLGNGSPAQCQHCGKTATQIAAASAQQEMGAKEGNSATPQPAPATGDERETLSDDIIRSVFLANGFTIKDGNTDLKPYVFAAARALLQASAAHRREDQDTKRLDALRDESWDVRSFCIGDEDVGWRVVEFHEASPHERVIAEVFKDDPRAAIDAAMSRE